MSTYLVTGSNRGIGLALCKKIKDDGHELIATCRNSSGDLNNLGVRVIENIDISSLKSLSKLEKLLRGISIDCLINNAGIAEYNSLKNLDPESIKHQFEINALSPLLITRAMIPFLKKNSKIAFITSRMGSIDDNTSGGSYGYRMSKVALSMAAKSLSVDLLEKDIYVAILHPGLVKTRMTGFTNNGIQAQESAKGILKCIENLNKNNSGTFWHANGQILPW